MRIKKERMAAEYGHFIQEGISETDRISLLGCPMGKRLLLLYSSRTGFTKRYAQWIGEDLGVPCVPLEDYRRGMEESYDRILVGGGIYCGELRGLKTFRGIQKRAPDQKMIYFAVGLRPASEETTRRILHYNFGEGSGTKLYYFQGGLQVEALDQKQRTMRTVFRSMLGRRRDLSEDDRVLLERLRVSGDYCDRTQTQEMIAYLADGAQENEGGGIPKVL